ncbi:hypothetical protein H1R20_g1282, partial [Candolleomyces eurysporus]
MPSEAHREKTPPPKANPPPPVYSTPFSRGTAQNSRSRFRSTNIDENIRFLEQDLEGTPVVEFPSMLKALLALQYLREVEPNLKRSRLTKEKGASQVSDAAKKFAERHYSALLKEAIQFCNDPKRSADLKDSLREAFRAKSETKGYSPIVRGLNSILCHFQNVRIGQLEASNDFVFMVNDPIPLRSANVSASGDDDDGLAVSKSATRSTKRKPDILDPSIRHLQGLMPENEHFGLDEWVQMICHQHDKIMAAHQKASKRGYPGTRLSWNDVTHCWELKSGKQLDEEHIAWLDKTFDIESILTTPEKDALRVAKMKGESAQHKRHVELQSESTSKSQKRTREDELPSASVKAKGRKKFKPDESSGNSGASGSNGASGNNRASESAGHSGSFTSVASSSSSSAKLSPKLQCGFYGVELLRSRWDRTHAIAILLDNGRLSLGWHDSQGCIGTASIDVVAQVPLLVAMIVLFQRFGKRMRGNAGWALQAEVDGKNLEYSLPDHARSGRGMRGRRLVTATPLVPRATEKQEISNFDLATIMTPGHQSPTREKFERTGTKPFMALTLLLAAPEDLIQPRCSHDLESVIWCLAWYITQGVEAWHENSFALVGGAKTQWRKGAKLHIFPEGYRKGSEHLWAPLIKFLIQWEPLQEMVNINVTPYSDQANMKLIDELLPYPKRSSGEEWDWMVWKVTEEDIRDVDRLLVTIA